MLRNLFVLSLLLRTFAFSATPEEEDSPSCTRARLGREALQETSASTLFQMSDGEIKLAPLAALGAWAGRNANCPMFAGVDEDRLGPTFQKFDADKSGGLSLDEARLQLQAARTRSGESGISSGSVRACADALVDTLCAAGDRMLGEIVAQSSHRQLRCMGCKGNYGEGSRYSCVPVAPFCVKSGCNHCTCVSDYSPDSPDAGSCPEDIPDCVETKPTRSTGDYNEATCKAPPALMLALPTVFFL